MNDKLTLKSLKKATFFNKSLLIGVLAGICSSVVGQIWGLTGVLVCLGTGVASGSFFAIEEKREEQRSNRIGKVVKRPTIWNKDMILGGLMGFISGNLIESIFLPSGGIIPIFSLMSGLTVGANTGKSRMEAEYSLAMSSKQQAKNHGKERLEEVQQIEMDNENFVPQKSFENTIIQEYLEKSCQSKDR